MQGADAFMFFRWFFKAWAAIFIVTHAFGIAMAVFDPAQRSYRRGRGLSGHARRQGKLRLAQKG
jgi:hypothetical protein